MASGKDRDRNSHVLDAVKDERMKTYSVSIDPGNDDRIKALYEAPADTQTGQACVKTLYVYIGTSSAVLFSKEVPAVWDETFETAANAKAIADGYTADELEELGL